MLLTGRETPARPGAGPAARPPRDRPGPRRGSVPWPLYLFDRLIKVEGDDAATTEAAAERSMRWIAICGLIYRLVAAPVPLAGYLGEFGLGADTATEVLVMGVVLAGNVGVLLRVLTHRSPEFLRRPWILVVDWSIAAGLNLWASSIIAPGTLDDAFRDLFWFYLMGTVALWAGLRGTGAAVAFTIAAVPLQYGMVLANGAPLNSANEWHMLARIGWILLAMVVVLLVVALLREGARLALEAGHRAGREAEQVRILRSMHDTVLQTLEAIVLQAGQSTPSEQRVAGIADAARQQAAELRAVLQHGPAVATPGLAAALREVVDSAASRGLLVELVTAEVDLEPPAPVRGALRDAVREALANVAKHAGVRRAVVRAVSGPDGVEVTVRDHGRGFDPACAPRSFGIPESVEARMREVGGEGRVWSRPGGGTRVRLWVAR